MRTKESLKVLGQEFYQLAQDVNRALKKYRNEVESLGQRVQGLEERADDRTALWFSLHEIRERQRSELGLVGHGADPEMSSRVAAVVLVTRSGRTIDPMVYLAEGRWAWFNRGRDDICQIGKMYDHWQTPRTIAEEKADELNEELGCRCQQCQR